MEDHRADGGRQARRQFEPVRPHLLRRFDLGCVPTSLSQEVGAALGGQAGEAKLREVLTGAPDILEADRGDLSLLSVILQGTTVVERLLFPWRLPSLGALERRGCSASGRGLGVGCC
jgi:hypothetical protein